MEGDEEEERVRMAPNMGAGGSHPQAMADPGREIDEGRGEGTECEGWDGQTVRTMKERREEDQVRTGWLRNRRGRQKEAEGREGARGNGEKARAGARGTAGSGRSGKQAQGGKEKSKRQERKQEQEQEQEGDRERRERREETIAQEASEDEESRAQEAREEESRAQEVHMRKRGERRKRERKRGERRKRERKQRKAQEAREEAEESAGSARERNKGSGGASKRREKGSRGARRRKRSWGPGRARRSKRGDNNAREMRWSQEGKFNAWRKWCVEQTHDMVAKRLVGPYGQRPTPADGARPSKSVASSHESSARSARNRTGRRGRKGEMGARDNGEKRKQHTARCLPFPKQRKCDSHCNKCHHSSSSNCSSTGSSTSTRTTPMIRSRSTSSWNPRTSYCSRAGCHPH